MARLWMYAGLSFIVCQPLYAQLPQTQQKDTYSFTLDGKPFTPPVISLSGDSSHPRPGDLICIDSLVLTLGDEKECHFLTTPKKDGRLLRKSADGKTRTIGVFVETIFEKDQDGENIKNVINPLDGLSAEEIKALWGIYVDEWPEGIAEKLKQINPARTCVSVTDIRSCKQKSDVFAALPADIRYLYIEERSNSGYADYEPLRRFSELRFLYIRAYTAKSIDTHVLANNRHLRYLSLFINNIEHPEALAQFELLEYLNLDYVQKLDTISFAAKMPNLKYIHLQGTSVSDLSPLEDKAKLKVVGASMTKTNKLPSGTMPALEMLEVFSTKLMKSDVDAFAQRNPRCMVCFRWDDALRQAVAKATKMRIRSGGTCHRNPAEEKTLFELKDAAKIKEFVKIIEINEPESGFHCMCCGEPSFEFYEGERLITTIGFHHGRSFRWPDRWPGDGLLTPESSNKLPTWLAAHGFDAFQKAIEAAAIQREVERKQQELFRGFFPEKARQLFTRNVPSKNINLQKWKEYGEQIVSAVGDPVDAAMAACRALGSPDRCWSDHENIDEQVAICAADAVGNDDFLKALEKLRGNQRGELGAARLCFIEEFFNHIPELQRSRWVVILARATLTQGRIENRSSIIPVLEVVRGDGPHDLLLEIARGETPKEIEPWKEGGAQNMEEPGVRANAYLALAKQGDRNVRSEIEKLLPQIKEGTDRATLEVSLALLGDPKFIKPEHFKIPSNRIGFAAIQAIENFGGREGMDVLVNAGLDHPWARVEVEAVLAVQRITGQCWCQHPENEWAYHYCKDIKKWWREHGAEFVAKRRAEKTNKDNPPCPKTP